MTWRNFVALLSGLSEDTMLVKVVSIRSKTSAKDIKELKGWAKEEWIRWHNKYMNSLSTEDKIKGDLELAAEIKACLGGTN